jgi:RNA polymerase sigma-54 factor
MALNQRLQLRQAQSLVMTPQLQQAIKLLQMSNLELASFVEEQLVENSLLEVRDPYAATEDRDDAEPPPATPAVSDDVADVMRDEGNFDRQLDAADTDFGNVWDSGEPGGSGQSLIWEARGNGGADGDSPGWENYAETPVGLREHLERQITLEFADPIELRIALLLMDHLDESGYFVGDFSELAYLLGVDQDAVAAVHRRFIKLDPAGIGARSLSECLRQQLAETGGLNQPMETLFENLGLVGKGEYDRLARQCGVALPELRQMLERLKRCSPRPAAVFDLEPAVTVIPDVFVRKESDGTWGVELNPDALPRVLVNRSYYAEIKQHVRGKQGIEFVTQQWQSANWLVKALDQRANTILKVTACIVQYQHGFFEKGISGLRPLTLRDVADEIGMHESTVSRVTNGKYAATPRGVLELRFFFSNAIGNGGGQDAHSAEAVRHRLRRMIEAETPGNILSDENLVELLSREGICVARRTVAKYRESMNIPSSARRRRLLKLEAG